MTKDGLMNRGLPDNTSTTEATELLQGPRGDDLHNSDRDSGRNNDASSSINNSKTTTTTVTATTKTEPQ
jgi:hypothetical protein